MLVSTKNVKGFCLGNMLVIILFDIKAALINYQIDRRAEEF